MPKDGGNRFSGSFFAHTDTLVTYSGVNTRVYNGFEASANARFGKGLFFGGVTTERTAATDCDVRDNPNSFRFCDNVAPFRTLVKASAASTRPTAPTRQRARG